MAVFSLKNIVRTNLQFYGAVDCVNPGYINTSYYCEVIFKVTFPKMYCCLQGSRPFACHICGKSFNMLSSLKVHEHIHVPVKKKPYPCDLCHRFVLHSIMFIAPGIL